MTTEQKFNCIFCKDTFQNKEELQDHFRKHGDPKYKNKNRFQSQDDNNEKSKEKTEMVSCDVCSKMFPTISKAITHKHKVHPNHDAKYFCQWCGKLFTMKHLYNVHVKATHDNVDMPVSNCFHCDSCDVDFFLPSAMFYHNKFFHRQDTDLPDVGQSKKIKLCNQEIVPIYYCAFCGEEFDNKVNLFKHMTDDHSDENQSPEEVLKCPLCEAVFFHLDAYEVHLTFHTPSDMYSVQNEALGEVVDYSLETVPPIIEKVESIEPEAKDQDTDAESTINAVGIEKFLELAMDQPDDGRVKVKKHKKHKKSKKSAITLDEFLSMNQDVFGEGLDVQGIEEVPTQVVKTYLKVKKKTTNPTNSVTLSDLEKLKNAGIIVKKKVAHSPIVNNLRVISKPIIKNNDKLLKVNPEKELTTSSAVLTKLINQSNNQIQIIKKSSGENITQDKNVAGDDNLEERKPLCDNTDIEKEPEAEPSTSSQTNAAIPAKVNSPDDGDQEKDESPPDSPIPTDKTPEDPLSEKDEGDINHNDDEVDPTEFDTPSITEKSPKIPQETEPQEGDLKSPKAEENQVSEKIDEGLNKNESQHSDSELDEKHENDAHSDDDQEAIDNNEKPNNTISPNINNSASASLSKLQQLSHLITVKPVSQSKMSTSVEHDKIPQVSNSKVMPQMASPNEKSNMVKPKVQAEKSPTIDALKNLNKNITVKSLSTKRPIAENECESTQFHEAEETNIKTAQNVLVKKIKVENGESSDKRIVKSSNIPTAPLNNKPGVVMKPSKTIVENEDNSVKSNNADILKRLTNITSKTISNKKVNNNNPPPVKPPEVIEIFDVDDSEDEVENNSNSKVEPSQNSVSSMDALKNLSKNIIVKSNRQPPLTKNMKLMDDIKVEKQNEDSSSNYKEDSNVETLLNIQNRNMAHVLKGLCKNITIKQGNSPKPITTPDNNSQEANVPEDNRTSDSDTYPGNVKITEMEQDMSDNEDNIEREEHPTTQHDQPIVETPYDSCSDKDDMEDYDEQQDYESESRTVQKSHETYSSSVNSVCLNNLKNISKNLTIKSVNPSLNKEENSKTVQTLERFVNTQKKQLPMKLNKQTMKEFQSNNIPNNKNYKKSSQFGETSTNLMHQKVNQVNTVNKEVTVKTFQNQTVIQEITTTVTKTIKRVNQTVKQELRTNYQTNGPLVPQKILGVRPNPAKCLQGVVVRHAAPGVGIKTNHTISQIRTTSSVVQPCKPNILRRTGFNSPRPNHPRMAVGKQVPTPPSVNTPGKSIKISPTAMISGVTKRHNTEDVSGPFSCFKKPKESLIPVSDIPSFTSSGESPAHFTAATHTSTSNMTNTKVVKGNSVVTAKVKSQTCQQFCRVNNNTGVKIMSSQAKQTQVQEKSETSAMNRTTLEAIQRLQKQGLLVKKPRTEVNDSSRSSNHDGDDSAEETDE
ncbi:unnamed protein product [Chrysodeixis includens]|uniref:C2H2-type domain-containing protein n=1 Tax=Chrysodeixis includens TaxID=689277 RepID=A0A9N8KTE7_CHRIL|nr:unnamed protein product [Chrysodeixis includens]